MENSKYKCYSPQCILSPNLKTCYSPACRQVLINNNNKKRIQESIKRKRTRKSIKRTRNIKRKHTL